MKNKSEMGALKH